MNVLLDDPKLIQHRLMLKTEAEMMRSGIVMEPDTQREYFTGYAYKTLYDWDQYFEAILQVYMGWPADYIQNGVMIFLDHQQESGLISRSVPSNPHHDPEHVKPFLAQMVLLVYRAYAELDWIRPYFHRLQKYIDYWLQDMDADQNGLSEWMSAPHTGMDNQHERAGWWLDRFSEGVDLNCYLVRELRAFSVLAGLLGQADLADSYRRKAEVKAETIRTLLWDETDGFFYDRNHRAGQSIKSAHAGWASAVNANSQEKIPVKSVSGFAALWAGVAAPNQAERMVREHLFNPLEFWTPYTVPALARSERWYSGDWLPADLGCNWRAKTWIPTNYMLYHGLRSYGYTQLASLLADRTTRLVQTSGNCEYYDAETGQGCGLDPFWGWSLLGHFLPYEETCQFNLVDLDEPGP